jgi:hypothetical protein
MERRRNPRKPSLQTQPEITIVVGNEKFPARLVDSSEGGLGIETRKALDVGVRIRATGKVTSGIQIRPLDVEGTVRWCRAGSNGTYRCGIATDGATAPSTPEDDYYEVLQVSQNADTETINRVFRLLAQRFHPDNRETGDENWFKVLVEAHSVLSDPQKRAAYDVRHANKQQVRWRMFDHAESAKGVEAERRKRQGLLSVLYLRRMNEPHDPGMTLQELERLLGCPKEHLEFALWFLKENAWVVRSDNGRVAITAKGVEKAEESGAFPTEAGVGADRMLPAPRN